MVNEDLDAVVLRASERLGYTAIRPNQHKAVKNFMEGSDAFISLPTGRAVFQCCRSRSLSPTCWQHRNSRVSALIAF